MGRRAIIMDRDGTLCDEVGYVNHVDRLRVPERCIEAVREANEAGFQTVVVTNQAGVARGYFEESLVLDVHDRLRAVLEGAAAISDPFEQAFFAMVHLAYLQAFEDVNKRVSRLAANIPLIRENLCPLSFVDVPERAYIDGVLGVYELNRIELLRDVFVWAYQRSCARYSAVRQSLGEPDPFRLHYRTLVAGIVAEIVCGNMDKKAATAFIKQRALEDVPQEDQARLIEVVETEVMSLHEGNIARYRLRPAEYQLWLERWH